MDYQFSYDILGQPVAACELDCEAFGDWLSHDIAQNSAQINQLLDVTQQLQDKALSQYRHIGKEYHLQFDSDEVELVLNSNHIHTLTHAQEDESQELTDLDVQSGCGLADFRKLLLAWKQFVGERN